MTKANLHWTVNYYEHLSLKNSSIKLLRYVSNLIFQISDNKNYIPQLDR